MSGISAAHSLLAIVDAQPGFYRDRPDVIRAELDDVFARIAWLAGVATALGIPAVVTNERPQRNGPTAGAISMQLPEGIRTFEKTTWDLCADIDTGTAVASADRPAVVIVGLETDVCVAQSAMGLKADGYRVGVVVDATYSPGAAHQYGLERARGCGVELLSAKGLFYEWVPSLAAYAELKAQRPDLTQPACVRL